MLAPIRWLIALVTALVGLFGGQEAPSAPPPPSLTVRTGTIFGTPEPGGTWVCQLQRPLLPRSEFQVLRIERAAPGAGEG